MLFYAGVVSPRSACASSASPFGFLVLIRSAALIALTSQLVRLRKLAETCDIALADYPNVPAWMQRIEAREGYKAAG